MSIRALLIACIFLAAFILSGRVSAYEYKSEITYETDTISLTGYSKTWKEEGDWNQVLQCVIWDWDDIDGFYCYIYFWQIAYASVIGEIYREELSDPVYGAYEWDYESASASHTIANPAGDNWTAEGYHYAEVDSYWVICPFVVTRCTMKLWYTCWIRQKTRRRRVVIRSWTSSYGSMTNTRSTSTQIAMLSQAAEPRHISPGRSLMVVFRTGIRIYRGVWLPKGSRTGWITWHRTTPTLRVFS